jgi:ParB/RepB/Spo0J family partition protein
MKERWYEEIALSQIRPSPENPRKKFDHMEELEQSIAAQGVLEPVLLRPMEGEAGAWYELVAGERRWRAAGAVADKNGGREVYKIPAMIQIMSDDEAFDVMTIENLHREDLSDLEEARGFQAYLTRKGEAALPELAERVGIDARYIRRRVAVLWLPEAMLAAWEKGKLHYGHLEQLTRVKDPERQKGFCNMVLRDDLPVTRLKEMVTRDAPPLKQALFDKEKAGCNTCQQNTTVQRALFGAELANTGGQCLAPACYRTCQRAWLDENWAAFREKKGYPPTNGWRFDDETPYDQYRSIRLGDPDEKCRSCKDYVSRIEISGKLASWGGDQVCVGKRTCYQEIYEGKQEKTPAVKQESRDAGHGKLFREIHYQKRLPWLIESLPPADIRRDQIALLAILLAHQGAKENFEQAFLKNGQRDPWDNFGSKGWKAILKLERDVLSHALAAAIQMVLMDTRIALAATRHHVAVHLGGDLTKDWQISCEYLSKKTIGEIHAIAAEFGFWQDERAQAFLYETLGKKRGKFDSCKKAELIRIILESGIELAGKVPKEILTLTKADESRW